jgi:putative N6-adenine-specific DNA methylase
MNERYFATVARGLEEIAAHELMSLGATDLNLEFTGVCFSGDRELLYRVNLWARTIFRVLKMIKTVPSPNADELYRQVQAISWDRYLDPDHTFAVHSTGGNTRLNHSHYTALSVKSAIADWQLQHLGRRSDIDVKNPDITINVHVREGNCVISLDSSGESLHRRGYRSAMGLAPLKETLAAALVNLTDWTPDLAFFDPMCGSGVLPIEAALKGLNVAPGLFRREFGFQSWLDYDPELWQQLLQKAEQARRSQLSAPILGSDADPQIIHQALDNAHDCNVNPFIQFKKADLADIEAPAAQGVLICNPPYGKRVGQPEALGDLYRQLGDILKQRFKGWTAFILSGNKELTKKIGLRSARRTPLYNGSIPCTLLKYELY